MNDDVGSDRSVPIPADRHILMIGGKDSGFRSVSDLGVRITLIQQRADVTPLQIERAHRLILLDTVDPALSTVLAGAVHDHDPLHAVVSFYESNLLLASRIGALLEIVHNDPRAVEVTRDKIAMRRLLARRGLPTVRFAECWTEDEVGTFQEQVGGRIILKPSTGSGSRGVALLECGDDIGGAWAWCVGGGELPVIAEEFVSGREFSVESLTRAGRHEVLLVTEKQTTGAPSFVETGHQMPARLDEAVRASMAALVTELLTAIGHTWGPAHTEIIRGEDGRATIVETQTRFGGDQIWEMVEHVTGIPLAGATVAAMLGLRPAESRGSAGGAAIRFFAYEDVIIAGVDGADDARAMPGVKRVDIRATAGATLGRLRGSWSRQGYVLALGRDTDDAVARAEAAFRTVRFRLQPFG